MEGDEGEIWGGRYGGRVQSGCLFDLVGERVVVERAANGGLCHLGRIIREGACEEMWGDVRRCGEMWGDVGRGCLRGENVVVEPSSEAIGRHRKPPEAIRRPSHLPIRRSLKGCGDMGRYAEMWGDMGRLHLPIQRTPKGCGA